MTDEEFTNEINIIQNKKSALQKKLDKLNEREVLLTAIKNGWKYFRVSGPIYSFEMGSYDVWAANWSAATSYKLVPQLAEKWKWPIIENTPTYDPITRIITRHPV